MNWATNTTERHIPSFVHLSTRGLLELRHLRYERLREVDHILERKWRGRSHTGRAPINVPGLVQPISVTKFMSEMVVSRSRAVYFIRHRPHAKSE